MAIWVVRAGSHGEHEQKFLQDSRVYLTWKELDVDLADAQDRESLQAILTNVYPGAGLGRIRTHLSQIWAFVWSFKKGDLVFVPLKSQPAFAVGEITGDYKHDPESTDPYSHWRSVKWLAEGVPRSNFGKDLLYSFGTQLTICRIQRNNAEERIGAMRNNSWRPEGAGPTLPEPTDTSEESDEPADLEELARDAIAKRIMAKFKGHGLTRIVDAILRAKGYTTYVSPEGADGGADILAGAGPLGFGQPRLCVEVKSGDAPIDRTAVDKLVGATDKFRAQEALFVSWSGFKRNVHKEMATSFFRVRLWTQKELLEQLFENYDTLDEDLKAELPLKRIWTIAAVEEE